VDNTAKKLISQEVVKDMTEQNLNILKEILLTDPIKINSAIDMWTKRKSKASSPEQARCERNIKNLYAILEEVVNTTMKVYNIDSEKETTIETKVETTDVVTTEEETTMVHQPPVVQEVAEQTETHESKLRVVRDVEDPREKYKDLIKTKTIEELISHFRTLPKEEATEAATFILGKGLYKAKKNKPWPTDRIANWLVSTVFKEVQQQAEETAISSNDEQDLEEKYKEIANTLTLAEIGEKIRDLVKNDKFHDALEMATYILSKGLYIDAQKESLNWNTETITVFFEQSTAGLSSETAIPDAEEVKDDAPFYDITYAEMYKHIDEASKEEGATMESLKAIYMDYLNTNTEKSIEKVDDLIKESNADQVWESLFAQTIQYRINEAKRKAELAKFEAEHVEEKNQILEEFMESDIKANKEQLETEKEFALNTIKDLKKILIDKGWTDTTLPNARDMVKELARRAAVNVKYFVRKDNTTEPTPLPETTETNTPDNVAIIGPEVSVNNKYPEIEDEVGKAKYLEDVHSIIIKYTEPDKVTAVLQLVTNAFLNKQIFEKSNDTEALNWTIEQVEDWFGKLNQTPIVVKEEQTEDAVEEPVVDAETDISKPAEEATAAAEATEEVSEPKTDNPFYKIKDKEGFLNAVADNIKKLQGEGVDVKTIRSTMANLIIDARQHVKKSFARNAYKKATPGELFNMINKVAIANNIEGFMNEHKETIL